MTSMIFKTLACIIVISMASSFGTSTLAGWDPDEDQKKKTQPSNSVQGTINRFKKEDPSIQRFFDRAYGYAVFPKISKGGLVVGGAGGKGYVYRHGVLIGYTSMSQFTVGAQIGGQSYSEMIFFKDQDALERFKTGKVKFSAQTSAVAVKAGAATNTEWSEGVAIFTLARGGLMAEASIGGQSFSYTPKK